AAHVKRVWPSVRPNEPTVGDSRTPLRACACWTESSARFPSSCLSPRAGRRRSLASRPASRVRRSSMKARIRSVPYYYARVEGDPDQAYTWLEELASADVDLLAFSALPYGPNHVEVTLFPVDKKALEHSAMARGANLVGPYRAFLIQGDDRLGALADIHKELRDA